MGYELYEYNWSRGNGIGSREGSEGDGCNRERYLGEERRKMATRKEKLDGLAVEDSQCQYCTNMSFNHLLVSKGTSVPCWRFRGTTNQTTEK